MRRAYYIEVFQGKKWQWLLSLTLGLLCALSASAQVAGWERLYGEGLDEGVSIIQTADEGFAMLGNDNFKFFEAIKTDPDGNVIWSNTYGDENGLIDYIARDMIQVPDGGYVMAGVCNNCGVAGGNRDIILIKIDRKGNEQWRETYGGGFDDDISAILLTSNDEIVIVGETNIDQSNKQIYFNRLDLNGTSLLENEEPVVRGSIHDEVVKDIIETDAGFIATGHYQEEGEPKSLYVINMSTEGDSLWSFFNGGSFETEGNSITYTTDSDDNIDGYIVTGATGTIANGDDLFIMSFDLNGDNQSTLTIGESLIQTGAAIDNTSDGGYIITGSTELSNSFVHVLLIKLNNNLEEEWTNTFGKEFSDQEIFIAEGFDVMSTKDGGYVITGKRGNFFSEEQIYLIKTNSQGNIFTNFIKGQVFRSSGNIGVEGWIVEARGNSGSNYYGTTDASGNYCILVDSDDYEVDLRLPNNYWNTNFGYDVIVTAFDTLDNVNFPVFSQTPCSDLEVDITSPYLIPGAAANNYYAVRYCNNGTLTAEDAFIDVELDSDLILMDATQPFVQIDSIYRFQLGDVPFGVCDSFFVNVFVATTTVQQTHCTKAQAYPNVICQPIGAWDESSLAIEAICDEGNDEVRFQVTNQGAGNVAEELNYIVIEDLVLRTEQPQTLQFLGSGESQSIAFEATGGTFRIISEQSTGHPGDSRPTAAIEGCGGFTPGMYTQFPENDYDHSISIDCQENLENAPAQLKRGYPKGYGEDREIATDTDLSYHLKFQNIGQDTAIRVVIRDTISSLLDPATIRVGASSHDYEFEVYGNGILKFTFEDILLPGSSTNEDESHIFVKFRISQKPDNDIDALIKNRAAATFEFDAPVLNTLTCHKIGGLEWEEFILVSTEHIPHPEVKAINVYPNPFTEVATFEIDSELVLPDLSFHVFDMTGRQLKAMQVNGMSFQFQRQDLSPGMYVYQIKLEGQLVSTGKMIVR